MVGPASDAVRMISVIAATPRDETTFARAAFVSLALNTAFVNAILAYRAILHLHIPTPQGDGIPLLDGDAFVNFHSLNVDDYNSLS